MREREISHIYKHIVQIPERLGSGLDWNWVLRIPCTCLLRIMRTQVLKYLSYFKYNISPAICQVEC